MTMLHTLLRFLVLVLRLAAIPTTWYLIWYYWAVIDIYVHIALGILLVGAISFGCKKADRDIAAVERARLRKIIARARTTARHRAMVRMTESSMN